MKINNLFIRSFRGATQPVQVDFDPGKSITMIFGENGNGKSTISDALVCLCTEDRGTIERASATKSYLCAIGSKPADTLIKLNTDKGEYSATLNPKKANTFLKAGTNIPALSILRRKHIIDLIDNQPSERYSLIQAYIDVEAIKTSEDELRKLVKTTDGELERELQTLSVSEQTLEKAWTDEGKPNKSWRNWAQVESSKDISKESKKFKALSELTAKNLDIKNKHASIKQQRIEISRNESKIKDLETELAALEKKSEKSNLKLLAVLEAAQIFVRDQAALKECPVCKQGVDSSSLLKSLDSGIASMKTLQSVNGNLSAASKELDRNKALIESSEKQITSDIKLLCSIILDLKGKTSKEGILIGELITQLDSKDKLGSYEAKENEIQQITSELDDEKARVSKTIEQFNLISSNYKTIEECTNKTKSLELLQKAVKDAHQIVEGKRKAFIDGALNSVSADIQRMYAEMHPDEALGDIKLFLKSIGKNSLEISSSFHSETEVTPQSLYSESHLDTLGICIFIALAKKYRVNDTILLLDDVMMSVDEAHLDRFIDLLHKVSSDFAQVIITTHYRPWRDRYRNNRADQSNVHFIELKQWSIQRGISLQNGKIISEELRQLLTKGNFEREAIANTAGRFLENLLDFMTFKFGSKLPRKPGNDYTLRELLDALSTKLVKVMKVEHLEKDGSNFSKDKVASQKELKGLVDKIKGLSAVRNQVGAHYNFNGSLVSDKDVREFGEAVLELADSLICPQLGSLPDRKPSGSYWETKSGSIRLYPLQEPS